MKYLRPYLKKYKLQSILAPAFKMLEAGFDLTVPLLVAKIIDDGIAAGNTKVIWTNFALMLLMALLGLACSFTAQYFAAKAAIGSASGLRRDLLSHIQSLSFTELDTIGTENSDEKIMLRNVIITAALKIYLGKLFSAIQKQEDANNG